MKKHESTIRFAAFACVCAAFLFIGCESPTDGTAGAAGPAAPGTLPSGATPEMLAALFQSTDKVIVGLPLGAGTFTVPAGKTLAVAGTVDITAVNTIINAFDGTLDVTAGSFTADSGNVFIVAPAVVEAVTAAAIGSIVPAYVASIPASPTEAITVDTVLLSLAIGSGDGETSATDFLTFAGSAKTVYVVGTTEIDASTPVNTGSAKLVALGGTTAKGTLTAGGGTSLGSLTASGNLTLTGVSKASELDTATFTVTSADTAVTLAGLDSGAGGKLALTGNVTAVNIEGGSGNIEFSTGTPALVTASSFGNTGTTTFKTAAGSTDVALSFAGPVVFEENVTRTTGGAYSFGGDVTLAATKTLTLGGTDTVTLASGKAIKAGTAVLLSATEYNNVVITPGDGAVLTAAAVGIEVSTAGIVFTGDVVFGGDLTLTDNEATFAGVAYFAKNNAVLTLTAAASKVNLDYNSDTPGAIAIGTPDGSAADEWKLALTVSDGAAADVVLTPAANTTLTFGSASGAKTIAQAGATGSITVGSVATLYSGTTYTVAGANTLAVANNGKFTLGPAIVGDVSEGAQANPKIVLTAAAANGAKLSGEGSVVAGGTTITGGNTSGTWTAGVATGTVTIEKDAITGDAASVAFTAGGHANAAITVAAATLTVDGVAITLISSYGKVVLTGSTSPGEVGKLLLKGNSTNAGKLDLGNTGATDVTIGSTTTNANFLIIPTGGSGDTDATVTNADGTAVATATGIVVKAAAADASNGSVLDYIAGGNAADTKDVLISGPSKAANSAIINTHKVKVPNT